MPFTTSKAKLGAELTSTSKKLKGKKVRSKAARDIGQDSDEDVYSDGNMYSGASDEEEGEDAATQKPSNPRLQLERTWSVSAFNISSHSAGVVYLDESDNSDTDDDSSSYDEFGSDSANDVIFVSDGEEKDKTPSNEIKSKKTRRSSRKKEKRKPSPLSTKRSSFTFRKEMKQRENAAEIIPEGDEEEEIEDISNSSNDNDNESESDDDSISDFQFPASMRRQSTMSKFSSNDGGNFDSGYSSDSALVRKRMQMLQQEQDARQKENTGKSSNRGKKKKKGGKKKVSSKKKEKKKTPKNRNSLEKENSTRSGVCSLEGDNSTATTVSGGSEEELRQSSEIKDDKIGKKKKKKKKQKTKKAKDGNKDGKKKKKRAVISFVVDGDDDACADFDKRLEEIEQFEAALVEERKSIQKERETMAFERESMEMRMDEESHHCEGLNRRIRELEQLVQSQKLSNAGNDAESSNEKNGLKLDFAREKREFHLQLVEKEREIEDWKLTVRELQMLQGAAKSADDTSFDSNNKGDGKSRERLQGELLQTVAKLSEKEAQLKAQSKELDLTREEVAALKLKCETSELKKVLDASKEDNKKLQQEMENERKENNTKLKDKDETVTFLMNELARLKKEQSISTKGR
jgi:hypothetical protein